MTVQVPAESPFYFPDGSAVIVAGQAAALAIILEQGGGEPQSLDGRYFAQRVLTGEGVLLAEIAGVSKAAGRVVFTFTAELGLQLLPPSGVAARDLTHVAGELTGEGFVPILTAPFALRRLRRGVGPTVMRVTPGEDVVRVSYQGAPGPTLLETLIEAGDLPEDATHEDMVALLLAEGLAAITPAVNAGLAALDARTTQRLEDLDDRTGEGVQAVATREAQAIDPDDGAIPAREAEALQAIAEREAEAVGAGGAIDTREDEALWAIADREAEAIDPSTGAIPLAASSHLGALAAAKDDHLDALDIEANTLALNIQNAAAALYYPDTAAALSNGVVGVVGLVAGSGGANGAFALAFSGGAGSNAAGHFVVAGGAVTSVIITFAGYGYTSAPTISFAASAGLTGASATAVIGANISEGEFFLTPSGSDYQSLILYQVVSGVAVERKRLAGGSAIVAMPPESGWSFMIRDAAGYYPFGVRVDGEVVAFKLQIPLATRLDSGELLSDRLPAAALNSILQTLPTESGAVAAIRDSLRLAGAWRRRDGVYEGRVTVAQGGQAPQVLEHADYWVTSALDAGGYRQVEIVHKASGDVTRRADTGTDNTPAMIVGDWLIFSRALRSGRVEHYQTELGGDGSVIAFTSIGKIACWGDSLTQYVGNPTISYPAHLSRELGGIDVYNGGVSGENSAAILARVLADTSHRDWVSIFWAGRNDTPSGFANVRANTQAMAAHLTPLISRWLMLGVTNDSTEPSGGGAYNTLVAANAANLAALGDATVAEGGRFWDVRAFMTDDGPDGALAYAGISPTAQDITDFSNDVSPSSLRIDTGHFNSAGYASIARKLREILITKGWF